MSYILIISEKEFFETFYNNLAFCSGEKNDLYRPQTHTKLYLRMVEMMTLKGETFHRKIFFWEGTITSKIQNLIKILKYLYNCTRYICDRCVPEKARI
jgi:hypothetical protein